MDTALQNYSPNTDESFFNYAILDKLGEGGYGYVYKARQKSTGQLVAIKVLKQHYEEGNNDHRRQKARFERETRLCAEVNHPHMVQLLDKGYTEKGIPFAVFEYVEGKTLRVLIEENNGLSARLTGMLMEQILDVLVSAHSKGIVHRDLKPDNIMVTKTGSKEYVKVLDFGIGVFTSDFRSNDYHSLTLTSEVIGTPAYSAPEQLRGEPPTIKSDLYAWGLIFSECLSVNPFRKGASFAEVIQKQLNGANVPLPASLIGHPVSEILRRVLEIDP